MSSEKSLAPVIVCDEKDATSTSARRCANRKCVIGAVTCAVVVAMIVVGVLAAIKIFTDADLERLKIHRKLKTGDALVDEDYYQDCDSGKWLLKYHFSNSESWALCEFDKGVQILKLQLKPGLFACFIVRQPVINGTAIAHSVRQSTTGNTVVKKSGNTTHVRYKIAIITDDISALIGAAGQKFCVDLSIYAAYPDPSQPQPDTTNHGRQRRQFYWDCYVSFMVCEVVTYEGSPYSYYECRRICDEIRY